MVRRAFDTKWRTCNTKKLCKLTFDDVYIILAQRIDTSKLRNDFIRTCYEEICQSIQNYINRPYVPCELRYIVCQLLVDLMNYYEELMVDTTDPDYEPPINYDNVSDIKVGDTQVKLGGSTSTGVDTTSDRGRALNSHIPNLDSMVFNYAAQLNKYRSLIPRGYD